MALTDTLTGNSSTADAGKDDSGRLSHAYIAAGAAALELAMAAVCSAPSRRPCRECKHCRKAERGIHPDIITVEKPKDKREIIVEQIRTLKGDVIVLPNEAERKAYIIEDADLMNPNAQNAFLKILEEPPSFAVLILKTRNPSALFDTVRSRCVEVQSAPEEVEPGELAVSKARDFLSAAEKGDVALTEFMFIMEKLDKEVFAVFLTAVRLEAAAKLRLEKSRNPLRRNAYADMERLFANAEEMLERNVGVGHLSGMLCAGMMSGSRQQ
jgi:hypothetical protein